MKVYNYSEGKRSSLFGRAIAFLAGGPVIIFIIYASAFFEIRNNGIGWAVVFLLAIGGMPIWLWIGTLQACRDYFCQFLIDEKGITSKFEFWGRDIFIAWDEMEYIGVGGIQRRLGEKHTWRGGGYNFQMYFSKTPPKRIFFSYDQRDFLSQNRRQFFIIYKEGMLEEILKYVDESRIRDIERIRNCPNPYVQQPFISGHWRIREQRDQNGHGLWPRGE